MSKGKIHPAIMKLGLKFSKGIICGSNARCVALLGAFRQVAHPSLSPPLCHHRTIASSPYCIISLLHHHTIASSHYCIISTQLIADYVTPPHKDMSRDLDTYIKPNIKLVQYTECYSCTHTHRC